MPCIHFRFSPDASPLELQAVLSTLGSTYPYRNLRLVLSSTSATTGTCTDVGTSKPLLGSYFLMAPFPQANEGYNGSPIAISFITTLAAYIAAVYPTTITVADSFVVTASALSISNAFSSGGDLSS